MDGNPSWTEAAWRQTQRTWAASVRALRRGALDGAFIVGVGGAIYGVSLVNVEAAWIVGGVACACIAVFVGRGMKAG